MPSIVPESPNSCQNQLEQQTMNPTGAAPIHVAAAAIFNERGQVLLSLRPDHVHQGGLWEFPGGKLQPGEAVEAALRRELREELGIEVTASRPLIRVRHDYPDRSVLLDVWRVDRYAGVPRGCEGQCLDWVDPELLPARAMPAADLPIVNAVRLPEIYLITGEPDCGADEFLLRLQRALDRGVRLVQLRAKTLGDSHYQELAEQAVPLCQSYGARVLLNAEPELAEMMGADGVHLSAARLLASDHRPLPRELLVAASCHNHGELHRARALDVDFVVVSPVLNTASHPGARPLGWSGLTDLSGQAGIPVYALGGMAPEHLAQAHACGAQGIAGIRSLWVGTR
jgi:8-oxo-dGTP diphosphatase